MAEKRTAGVEVLVRDVLASIPQPYSEDIIEEVCMAIESSPAWKQRYDELGVVLHPTVVNNWIGQYVKDQTGYETLREVTARRSSLIKNYSKLIPSMAKPNS